MTKRVLFTFILAFLPLAANAASKNSAQVVLSTVTVGTTEVPKGTYKVVWTGTEPKCAGNVH